MTLIDRLRSAEQQSRGAAWQGFSWAWTNLEEAQSRLRRKMRIHPRKAKASFPLASAQGSSVEPEEPVPIISINGEDVANEDVELNKREPKKPKDEEEEQVA
jgi:hypothetical protein